MVKLDPFKILREIREELALKENYFFLFDDETLNLAEEDEVSLNEILNDGILNLLISQNDSNQKNNFSIFKDEKAIARNKNYPQEDLKFHNVEDIAKEKNSKEKTINDNNNKNNSQLIDNNKDKSYIGLNQEKNDNQMVNSMLLIDANIDNREKIDSSLKKVDNDKQEEYNLNAKSNKLTDSYIKKTSQNNNEINNPYNLTSTEIKKSNQNTNLDNEEKNYLLHCFENYC